MNVREWTSSNSQINATLQPLEHAPVDRITKLLGLTWNIVADTLSNRVPFLQHQMDHLTKRSVLKIIASIYDSLGFIAPVTVVAKMFLQSLWKKQLQCYERLPEDKQKKMDQYYILLDSTWAKTTSSLPVYVQNHVKDIKKNAPNAMLRYVPTNYNPADLSSRGNTILELLVIPYGATDLSFFNLPKSNGRKIKVTIRQHWTTLAVTHAVTHPTYEAPTPIIHS
ncbi:hypothetical protein NECAME_06389 [Necator americanus]|uniref:Uncharacterized protein n=1 Tax=Necator americanus TaxID=51031 RepID=W2TWJ9_NECAM|nr:hypothetical protein NECAME_06389 [Necator americanus]ETN85436.1 hypothetical protein NECAME_06389 [Necator americanus]